MADKRPTQCERLIQYMDQHGSITRLESSTDLFIFELAARINNLESRGWVFDKVRESKINAFGEKKSFTRYSILKRGEW